jgi:lipid-A-disaccharide synthase
MSSNELVRANFPLPAPSAGGVDVLIIAGEHSGDEQAARMIKAALARKPSLKIVAMGGQNLQNAGAELVCDMMPYAIVGIFEVLKHYSAFKELRDGIIEWILKHQPKAVCFVDYPGLNLRLAKILDERKATQKSGGPIRLLFYISPQVWVWKAKRRFKMAEYLDTLGVIFPFEVKSFEDTTLETKFVGHPFLSEDYELPTRYDPNGPVLLLPGSRSGAISRIAPIMFDSLQELLSERKTLQAKCIFASQSLKDLLESILEGYADLRDRVELVSNELPVKASCVLTSSGTMSLNCALAGIPGAIVYRVHPVTYFYGRMVMKIPYIGIANLLLDRSFYPEFIQGAARPEVLVREMIDCIENPERIERVRKESGELRTILDKPAGGGVGSWLVENIGT